MALVSFVPTLRSELEEKNALIKSFGKTKVVESSPPIDCSVCPGLISDLDSLAVEKANLENENTYLRAILSWVSSSEPQFASTSTQPSLVDPADGVLKEPPKTPPQKQVWVPKPNELRNPLDTLPAATAQVAQKKRAVPPRP